MLTFVSKLVPQIFKLWPNSHVSTQIFVLVWVLRRKNNKNCDCKILLLKSRKNILLRAELFWICWFTLVFQVSLPRRCELIACQVRSFDRFCLKTFHPAGRAQRKMYVVVGNSCKKQNSHEFSFIFHSGLATKRPDCISCSRNGINVT